MKSSGLQERGLTAHGHRKARRGVQRADYDGCLNELPVRRRRPKQRGRETERQSDRASERLSVRETERH